VARLARAQHELTRRARCGEVRAGLQAPQEARPGSAGIVARQHLEALLRSGRGRDRIRAREVLAVEREMDRDELPRLKIETAAALEPQPEPPDLRREVAGGQQLECAGRRHYFRISIFTNVRPVRSFG